MFSHNLLQNLYVEMQSPKNSVPSVQFLEKKKQDLRHTRSMISIFRDPPERFISTLEFLILKKMHVVPSKLYISRCLLDHKYSNRIVRGARGVAK